MLTINENRLLQDLDNLAQIGGTPEGGVTRLAFSEEDLAGREWFRQRTLDAGLEFQQDGAGNISAILRSDNPTAKTLMCGSHLDTVANGGRFDGALGVLSALEAIRTIKEAELNLPFHLEAISFTDEEGTILGLLGSQAVAGQITPHGLAHPRGSREALQAGMKQLGINFATIYRAKRTPESLVGFIEIHVEQGSRLEEMGLDLGVVTSVVGIRSGWLRFGGQAAHAGATPLNKRADALWGASAFIQKARKLVWEQFSPGVCNFGQLHVQPGAFNIVPDQVDLALEFRHGTEEQLDEMQTALFACANQVAAEYGLALSIESANACIAAPSAPEIITAIEQAADNLGLSHTRLMSFAGHDAQSMSAITPSAMIFVPSVDGISHNPREYTPETHVVHGANTLLNALLVLAEDGKF